MSDERKQPELPIAGSGQTLDLRGVSGSVIKDLERQSGQNSGDGQGLFFDLSGEGPIFSNLHSFRPIRRPGSLPPYISPEWQGWPLRFWEKATNTNELHGGAAATESQNSQFPATNSNAECAQRSSALATTSNNMQFQMMLTMCAGNSDNLWGYSDPLPPPGPWPSFPACYKPTYSIPPGQGYFYVDKAALWNPEDGFRVIVFDPTEEVISVELEKENLLSSTRIVCSFEFTVPGIYTASVLLGSTGFVHASGSPMEFPVIKRSLVPNMYYK